MQTSLVRLRARPATSVLRPPAGSAQHHRHKSYKIQERGPDIKEKHQNAVNRFIRKVRFGAREGPAAPSTNDRTRQEQEGASQEHSKNDRRRPSRKLTPDPPAPLYQPERNIEMQRKKPVNPAGSHLHANHPILPFIDHVEETQGRGLDKNDMVQERDKWGKSPDIWLTLLQREARLKGHMGIEQVWTLIKEADADLPVKSAKAGELWTTLLSVPKLHDDVVAHAIRLYARTGRAFPPLYTLMVGYLLRESSPAKTLAWHLRFLDSYVIPRDALQKLAIPASLSDTNLGLEVFRTIYGDLHKMCEPCYDQFVPALLRAGRFRQALRWHSILVNNNDAPSAEVARTENMQAFLQLRQSVHEKRSARWRRSRARELERSTRSDTLFKAADALPATRPNEEPRSMPEPSLNASHEIPASENSFFIPPVPVPHRIIKTIEKAASMPTSAASKRGLFSSLFTEVQKLGHDGFSDEFCARLYATRALTLSWVTSFLHAFSVKKIGSFALRELALRCESTEDLQFHIRDLKANGMSIGSSVFCRAIKKCADDGQVDILRGLLHSDQHPDNLDDKNMQRKVLCDAVTRQDAQAVHYTLTLMSMFAPNPRQEYMNILLCSYMQERRIDDVIGQASKMQFEGVKITGKTIEEAMFHLLRPRHTGKRPNMLDGRFQYDDLTIVTNLVIRALEAGTEMPEWVLVELFKRHGMKNLDSLERFCHAVVDAYRSIMAKPTYDERARAVGFISLSSLPGRQQPSGLAIRAALPFANAANPLHSIFTPRRLQFIIAWGFHEGLRRLAVARDKHQRPHSQRSVRLANYRRWPAGVPPPPPQKTVLRGLEVVQGLTAKGINMWTSATEAALKQRLWILYGPGRSKKGRNVTSMALNPYGIVEVLRAVDKMWTGPKPIFAPVREMLLPLPPEPTRDQDTNSVSEELFADPNGRPNLQGSKSEYDSFGSELPSDELSKFALVSTAPTQDRVELQLRMHTEALVRIFWTCRTLGVDGDVRATKKALTKQQWSEVLHQWARQAAMKRFSA